MIHVPYVQAQALVPGLRIVAVDLRPTRDPGAHLVSAGLLGGVPRQVFDEQWPRSDEAHVAAKHVPKLRKLIETQAAQPTTRRGESLLVAPRVAAVVSCSRHRAKLDQL